MLVVQSPKHTEKQMTEQFISELTFEYGLAICPNMIFTNSINEQTSVDQCVHVTLSVL